jgi:RNA polymerase sigma-70 factor (ECF subfamily)
VVETWVGGSDQGRFVISSRATQFNDLYERHNRTVLAYCLRRTSDADAYDAASEVFAVAWRRLDDLPKDRELAWLYGVARRVLSRQWRGARRFSRLVTRVETQPRESAPDVASVVVQRDGDSQVLDALAKLKGSDQEILRLAAWEGLPRREIAEVLRIAPSSPLETAHGSAPRQPSPSHRFAMSPTAPQS